MGGDRLRTAVAALLCGAGLVLIPGAASAESVSGTIEFYECGDNCYLTLTLPSDEEVTGLCAAEACQPWNEVAEMPSGLIGRKVMVEIEMGQQTDADGNLMGEFPAFTELKFLD